MIAIQDATESSDAEVDAFIRSCPNAMLYASGGYRQLLRRFLDADECSFLARDASGAIVGFLPAFLRAGPLGPVLNSLPFYGSNGGVIAQHGNATVRRSLLHHFDAFARSRQCASATMITSPFDADLEDYLRILQPTHQDERIGQLTPLPAGGPGVADRLMALYHHKTRNMVRKAVKSGVVATVDNSPEAMSFVAGVHHDNVRALGGLAKPPHFFHLVSEVFEAGREYRIFVALHNGQPVAALLLLYFNSTVEYFTPVVLAEHRTLQPVSLLVHVAMQNAVAQGFKWWNWGGTWKSQESLYHFKSRWGTVDRPYHYFTTLSNQAVFDCTPQQLASDYPFFFVIPFSALTS